MVKKGLKKSPVYCMTIRHNSLTESVIKISHLGFFFNFVLLYQFRLIKAISYPTKSSEGFSLSSNLWFD